MLMKMTTVSMFLKKENNNLDFIRITCAFMVIYGHAFFLADKGSHKDIFTQLFPFTYAGAIAVKVFFFISGMLVTTSLIKTRSPSIFLTSRFLRIFPAFIVTVSICALIIGPLFTNLSVSEYFSSNSVPSYIYKNIIMDIQYFLPGVFIDSAYKPAINGSLWTIPYEVASYISLLSIFIITGMNNKLLINTICIIIISSPLLSDGVDFITQTSNKDIYFLAPCFYLGVMYAVNSEDIKVNISIPLSFFAIFSIVPNVKLSQLFFYFGVCSMFVFIASTNLIRKIKIKNDISYGVYLWGFVVQQIVYIQLPSLNLYSNILTSSLLTYLIATISYTYIEKPSMNVSYSIRKSFAVN